MKTKILIVILFLFGSGKLYSQEDLETHNAFIGISLGPSMPVGDFASKDIDNQSAGFASSGAIFDINFTYNISRNWGFTASLRGQSNPFDENAFENELENENPGTLWTIHSEQWSIGGLLIGAVRGIPISEDSRVEIRAMFGFLRATLPNVEWTGRQGLIELSGKTYSASASAFTGLIGVGYRYNITSMLALTVNADYLGAQPEFRDVKTATNYNTVRRETFRQKFGSINFGVGLGFLFD
ncbi:MAG TPA: hypothetical protein VEC12_04045 [Bacteroidia bacterium]|nr:hypothetical protein [Bacteroidia bacterium]